MMGSPAKDTERQQVLKDDNLCVHSAKLEPASLCFYNSC